MHSLLAATPEGLPLGLLGMKTWVCAQEEAGKGRHRKARPIAEKEIIKWIEGIKHLAALTTRCAETRFFCGATTC
ncbi:Transposase [Caballeronia sordidicola]|uniref:Transposase n=1 Tax=Caballeronia sordidicola TaxID=196367 RepID=A0A242MBN3_CABSO|nr:Transposase [Caballeronia sordidicola]